MKIEKLELKHLSGYLPYGLIWDYVGLELLEMNGISKETVWTDKGVYNWTKHPEFPSALTPILRPLSLLTEEIIHEGEKFVPILKLSDPNSERTDKLTINYVVQKPKIGDEISVYDLHLGRVLAVNISNIKVLNYYMVEKLFEWKFDIYSLIDSGLAIDSTKCGNPYDK